MKIENETNAKIIWDFFIEKGLTQAGTAGLMGNLYAESGLIPTNLQNNYEKSLNYTDAEYTESIDSNKYKNFINDKAGYGIAQWTYWTRKKALQDFAKKCNSSIGSLQMQLNFLYHELSTNYQPVLKTLLTTTNVQTASDSVLLNFERPANMSSKVKAQRASYSMEYYKAFKDVTNIKKDNTPDPWAKEAIEWAVKNNILSGDNIGNYKLHSTCTRQEVLIFLRRFFKLLK